MKNGKRVFETAGFIFLFMFAWTALSFSQHIHGGGDEGKNAVKSFQFGNISVEYSIKPYPLERGKKHEISVNVLNSETQQPAADVSVTVMFHPEKEGMDMAALSLNASPQNPSIFLSDFTPAAAGDYHVMLEIKTSELAEPLAFSFSETINEKQKFMEKMMDKGMKMHHKMHSNWMLLGLMGAAMLVGHDLVH